MGKSKFLPVPFPVSASVVLRVNPRCLKLDAPWSISIKLCAWLWGQLLECGLPLGAWIPEEPWLASSNNCQLSIVPQTGVEPHNPTPISSGISAGLPLCLRVLYQPCELIGATPLSCPAYCFANLTQWALNLQHRKDVHKVEWGKRRGWQRGNGLNSNTLYTCVCIK